MVAIVALVAIGVVTFGLLVAPAVGQTGSFDGSVNLSGDAATASTSWSYEIADLDSVEDLSVELEGDRVSENVSESSKLASGESFDVEPGGNAPPEEAAVEIEGVREETDQSQTVTDGDSISVGGNVAPESESISIEGTYSETERTLSGSVDGSTTETIPTDGSLSAQNTEISVTSMDDEKTDRQYSPSEIWITTGLGAGDGTGEASVTFDTPTVSTVDTLTIENRIDGNVEADFYLDGEFAGNRVYPSEGNNVVTTLDVSDIEIGDTTTLKVDRLDGNSGAVWEMLSYHDHYVEVTQPATSSVSASSSSDSASFSSEGTKSLTFSKGETIDLSSDGPAQYEIRYTERSGAEDVSVSVDGETLSEAGAIDGSVSESVDLSRGTHDVDVSYTGELDSAAVNWTEIDQTEDPTVDVGSTTLAHSGLLEDGETVSKEIDLSEGETETVERTGGSNDAIVRASWTEIAETQNPGVEINGETETYDGTLADGQTTELDVSSNWIEEGVNTVDVELDGSNGGPEPQVGVSYQHSASTVSADETVNSTTWSEDVEVARTFASDQSDVELRIGMPENVVGIDEIDERRDGGNWSSVSEDNYELDGTDLVVDMGDVAANESVEVRAVGDKTRVSDGSIEVVEPTLEGATLSTRMRVTDVGEDPLGIEVSETAAGDRIHTLESADWESEEYHISEADGTETLYLPEAIADGEATVETVPLAISPASGDTRTEIDNRSEMRFSLGPGSSSGDDVEVEYHDTESGQYYELFSVSEDRQIDRDQAESPVLFETDDRENTYLIRETDPPGTSVIAGGASGSGGGGLPPALLLLAGVLGVGAVGLVSQRFGLGRRITIPAAFVATIGIAELSTPSSLIGTLSNDLIRSSSETLVAAIVTAGALAVAIVVSRRTSLSVPTWGYGAIGVGGAAWIASSAFGDAGSSIVGVLVGGGILVALWGASRRWELPRWLLGIVGGGATLFMLDSIAPAVLEGVVGAITDGAGQIAPLVVVGLLIALVVWLRRSGTTVVLGE